MEDSRINYAFVSLLDQRHWSLMGQANPLSFLFSNYAPAELAWGHLTVTDGYGGPAFCSTATRRGALNPRITGSPSHGQAIYYLGRV